jgi:hypothetical protein
VLCAFVFGGAGDGDGPERRARLLLWKEEGASDGMWSRGEAGTANVAFLESGGVISTSSALRFPFAVSERSGDDRGVWCGAVSDAAAAAATREKEGIRAEASALDDEEEAIGVGEGLALALRELRRGFWSRTRGASCGIPTTLSNKDRLGSYKLWAIGS